MPVSHDIAVILRRVQPRSGQLDRVASHLQVVADAMAGADEASTRCELVIELVDAPHKRRRRRVQACIVPPEAVAKEHAESEERKDPQAQQHQEEKRRVIGITCRRRRSRKARAGRRWSGRRRRPPRAETSRVHFVAALRRRGTAALGSSCPSTSPSRRRAVQHPALALSAVRSGGSFRQGGWCLRGGRAGWAAPQRRHRRGLAPS